MVQTTTLGDLGSAMGVATSPQPAAPQPKMDAKGRSYATGRRKNAVARVWLKRGAGRITVNGKPVDIYFARATLRMMIQQPLVASNRRDQFDIECTVSGGGLRARPVRFAMAFRARSPTLSRTCVRPEEGRFHDPRQPRRRTQEIRPCQGAPQLPVLEALSRNRHR